MGRARRPQKPHAKTPRRKDARASDDEAVDDRPIGVSATMALATSSSVRVSSLASLRETRPVAGSAPPEEPSIRLRTY
jgi:hypothetical protein